MLTNTRITDDNFSSFHLLPWHATVIYLSTAALTRAKPERFSKKTLGVIWGSLAVTTAFVYIHAYNPFIKPKNLANEHYINYSASETYGKAVKTIKTPNSRLLVMPNDPLIYWVSQINTPTRIYEYYEWIYPIPEYQNELETHILENPPEFVVDTGLRHENRLEAQVLQMLDKHYIRLNHTGTPSKLYVRKDIKNQINEDARKTLAELLFAFPNTEVEINSPSEETR